MSPITPQTPYDLFTFFLEPEHLCGKSHTVKIISWEIQDIWDPRIKQKKPSVLLRFESKQRALKLNKTQMTALMDIAGDQFNDWIGKEITLTPAKATNGKDTITITAHPPSK